MEPGQVEPPLERRLGNYLLRGRWNLHLSPTLGKLRAADVDTALIRKFVETKIRGEMNRTTIGLCIRCLSTFYSDLCERPSEAGATHNPVAGLPRSLRRLYKSQHHKRLTLHVRQLADVIPLYQAFERPFGVAYAIGSFAGLRTGEIPALEWERIDLDVPRIEVNDQTQNGQRTRRVIPLGMEWELSK